MTETHEATYRWDHVYRAVIDGSEYPWEIRSQMALAVGHKFFLPLVAEAMVRPGFARPIWKPRLSPDFAGVEVVEVDGQRLLLQRIDAWPAGS